MIHRDTERAESCESCRADSDFVDMHEKRKFIVPKPPRLLETPRTHASRRADAPHVPSRRADAPPRLNRSEESPTP